MPKESRWLLLRTGSGRPVLEALQQGKTPGTVKVWDSNQTQVLWNEVKEGDYAMAHLLKIPVLVLSQTCDIQQKDFIQVAPIFPAAAKTDYLQRLEQGNIFSAFHLPQHAPEITEPSFADLEQIQAVHKSYIRRLASNQHFRIHPSKTRKLQSFLTRYFGRPNAFDSDADICPRTGTYLCVNCFYMKGEVSAVVVQAKQNFEPCNKCGGRSWALKGL